jgi:hypothetical protein
MSAAPDTVVLAYVHGHEVTYSWHASLLALLGHDMAHHNRITRGGFISVQYGTGGIVDARNKVAAQFLDGDDPWLFWIDTDMGFAPDTVESLLRFATERERPMVGALCFAQRELHPDALHGFITGAAPTLYDFAQNDEAFGFLRREDYERDALQQVAGTGSACVLIHRSVYEKIAEKHGFGSWYMPMRNPSTGQWISEDLSFCARVNDVGGSVWVDTRVKTSHLKHQWVQEAHYAYPEAVEA